MGIVRVADLQEVTEDDQLRNFKMDMIKNRAITLEQAADLRAFYDPYYAPMEPVYCMLYPNTLKAPPPVFEGVTSQRDVSNQSPRSSTDGL